MHSKIKRNVEMNGSHTLDYLAMGRWLLCSLAMSVFLSAHARPSDAAADQREVFLTAIIRIDNRGDEFVRDYTMRLTVPVNLPHQQQLLDISAPGQPDLGLRAHPNQVDKFLSLRLRVPSKSVVEQQVQFQLRLNRFDYRRVQGSPSTDGNANFLRSTTFVESNSQDIRNLANAISAKYVSDEDRLLAAYQLPQQTLKYRLIENRGALFALHNGYGDCTEYAALFVALARAMGHPARLTSEFNFLEDHAFDQPNHHAAEVFLKGQWIPVDPNLGVNPKSEYGFGRTGLHKIVLKRDGSWVWATSVQSISKQYLRENIRASVAWFVKMSP